MIDLPLTQVHISFQQYKLLWLYLVFICKAQDN